MEQGPAKQTFLSVFDTYNDAIFRFSLVKTSNRELAEDLTQETFMRYWQMLSQGKEMTNTRSLLYTIANNLIIDWYRKKKSTSLDVLQETGFEPEQTGVLSADSEASFAEILETIKELDDSDREVLMLRFIEGLEPRDIAEILEVTANVVSVRINRALTKVQQKLHI